jgi:hypothetical protein
MTKTVTKKALTKEECYEIYTEAYEAGINAGNKAVPTPIVVGEETSPFSGQIDHQKKTYFVPEGLCGFAWVNIRPARGNFVKFLEERNAGYKDSYYGGYSVWVREFNQSHTRKVAFAQAFAQVLQKYGFEAYVGERLD